MLSPKLAAMLCYASVHTNRRIHHSIIEHYYNIVGSQISVYASEQSRVGQQAAISSVQNDDS